MLNFPSATAVYKYLSMIIQIKNGEVLDIKIRLKEYWLFRFGPNIRPLFRRNRIFAETLIFGRNSPKPNIRSVTSYNAEQSKLDKFWKLMINCYQNQKFNDFKFLINFVVIEQFNVNTEIRYIFIHIHICVHVLLDRK